MINNRKFDTEAYERDLLSKTRLLKDILVQEDMQWIRDAIAAFEKHSEHTINREIRVFITKEDLVDFNIKYNRRMFVAHCFMQLDNLGVLDT